MQVREVRYSCFFARDTASIEQVVDVGRVVRKSTQFFFGLHRRAVRHAAQLKAAPVCLVHRDIANRRLMRREPFMAGGNQLRTVCCEPIRRGELELGWKLQLRNDF